MEIKFKTEELKTALKKAVTVVDGKGIIPITSNFLVEIKQDHVWITGTNLQNFFQVRCNAIADNEGGFCVEAEHLTDSVSKFKHDEVFMEVDNNRLHVKSGRNKLTLPLLSKDDFPYIPKGEPSFQSYEAETFLNGISSVKHASANDPLRPVMNGILVEQSDASISFTATDAHMLTSVEFDSLGFESFRDVIPNLSLKSVMSLLSDIDLVSFGITESHLVFKDSDHILYVTKISGTFPKWQDVVPKDYTVGASFNREDIVDALKVTSKYTSVSNGVLLTINEDSIDITAENLDYGVSASATIPSEVTTQTKILVNKKLLESALNNIQSETIELEYTVPTKSVIMRNGNLFTLIMLMQING